MEILKLVVACFGAIILVMALIDILIRPSQKQAIIKACKFIKSEDTRQQALEDYKKAKEKAVSAYDAKLAQSDYKEIEDILRTMTAALNPLVEKRHRALEEAAAEYKKVMDEERAKYKDNFLLKCLK